MHEKILIKFIPLILLAALVFAGVSLFHHTQVAYGVNVGPSFCNISATFNCDAVNASSWSTLFGVPLASYGLAFYLGIFLFWLAARDRDLVPSEIFAEVLFAQALLATLFSVFLFAISEIQIGAICLMCVGMYLSNFALLLVAYGLLVKPNKSLVASFFSGLKNSFKLPFVFILGSDRLSSNQNSMIKGYVCGAAALMIGILFTPKFIYAVFYSNKQEQQTFEQLMEVAWKDWQSEIQVDIPWDAESYSDFSRGPENAPIRIVEFADFECSACRSFYRGFEEIIKEFPGKIHYVYRNYPLDNKCNPLIQVEKHKSACFLSAATFCAAEQGKFWNLAHFIFYAGSIDSGAEPGVIRTEVEDYVASLSIDVEAFKQCLAADRINAKIAADLAEGNRLGVTGTPSIWINGKKVRASHPIIIKNLIQRFLKKS